MIVEKLDMKKYLGRGIKVYFKNGESMYFKPIELNGDTWIGYDDEMVKTTIHKNDILCVK